MKKLQVSLVLLTLGLVSSCATGHATRYAYGEDSFFQDAEEGDAWRAVYGAPVILGALAWDVVTFPFQAIFGVWPWWGSSSHSMDPAEFDTSSDA